MEEAQLPVVEDEEIFSLAYAEEQIKIKNVNGEVEIFTIREFDGVERDKYRNFIQSKIRWEGDKIVGFKNQDDLEVDLLQRCLYGPDGVRVKADVIRKWPASLQIKLADKAKKICGLDDGAKAAAKNS